jgi:hypothetical protein
VVLSREAASAFGAALNDTGLDKNVPDSGGVALVSRGGTSGARDKAAAPAAAGGADAMARCSMGVLPGRLLVSGCGSAMGAGPLSGAALAADASVI